MLRDRFRLFPALLLAAACAACSGPEVRRGTDDPSIDDKALSTGLDRRDVDRAYENIAVQLLRSPVVEEWNRQAMTGTAPVVAIFPMRNETSEHIEGALDALLTRFETDLVNGTRAAVVARRDQPDLMAEIGMQQSGGFDPARVAAAGKQIGAQFFVTGRVHDVAERLEDTRRVQYFMAIQVIDVSTGQIRFQRAEELTKELTR